LKKKILATVILMPLIVGIIFTQAALGAYYITGSGQKIGYNQNTSTYSNYYSLQNTKITSSDSTASDANQTQNNSLPEPSDYSTPVTSSTDYITVDNQKIYYNNKTSGTGSNYYSIKLNRQTSTPTTSEQQPVEQDTSYSNSTYKLTASEQKLIQLINQERTKTGLKPLIIDYQLCRAARKKTEDMNTNHYFSHTSPTYGSPFKMMRDFSISYKTAAENLGKTYGVESAHAGFMNSEGHRNNILNPGYTHVGVGISGKYYVEMFISK